MTARPAFTRSWPVGSYTAELTVPMPGGDTIPTAVVEWSPDVPTALTASERAQYQRGRDAAFAEYLEALGFGGHMVDL